MMGSALPLRSSFESRADLIDYIASQFPEAASRDSRVSPIVGGLSAAKKALSKVEPVGYGWTRNYLNGKVTRLSMYIRHGVLSLAEVRNFALSRVKDSLEAGRLLNELAWRDYWQRIYSSIGDGIWADRERFKTGWSASDYSNELPADVVEGTTGLCCIDSFSSELRETGYIHNHARMWLASYIVHWRKVKWQAGARWFLEHLVDGDPASNNLSWQWVASCFSNKPYIFNRETVERYTNGAYCKSCSLRGRCEFEASYDQLSHKLFRIV